MKLILAILLSTVAAIPALAQSVNADARMMAISRMNSLDLEHDTIRRMEKGQIRASRQEVDRARADHDAKLKWYQDYLKGLPGAAR